MIQIMNTKIITTESLLGNKLPGKFVIPSNANDFTYHCGSRRKALELAKRHKSPGFWRLKGIKK